MPVDRLPTPAASSNQQVMRGFVPTRRFATVSFETYFPDPRFPSQSVARERLRHFAQALQPSRQPRWLPRLGARSTAIPRAIYLDGGYGVGKTHLLAATYHAVPGHRAYLSFAELAYTIARLGMQPTLHGFASTRLLCIDEFELDDVAQTRMAAMFLRELFGHRRRPAVHVVTTSNTLPSDLGQGRFAAEAFAREIGEIAAAFDVLRIDGEDYRHRQWHELASAEGVEPRRLHALATADPAPPDRKVVLDWPDLAAQLERVHPVHYGQIAARLDALFVADLQTIHDQAVALRLVHFVDKLYDQEVRLVVSTAAGLHLQDVFAPTYRHGGYEKKYRRCLSRLHELISETSHRLAQHGPASVR